MLTFVPFPPFQRCHPIAPSLPPLHKYTRTLSFYPWIPHPVSTFSFHVCPRMQTFDTPDSSQPSSLSHSFNDVARTSVATTYWRAKESLRPEPQRLIYDDIAIHIVENHLSEQERHEFLESPLLELCSDLMAVRTHTIDRMINEWLALKDKKGEHFIYHQIVLLGCGLDMRHYRLQNLKPNATVYELDVKEVLDSRFDVLAQIQRAPKCIIESVPVDVGEEFALLDALSYRGYIADLPTIFVAEGLLEYLNPTQLDNLFASLARVAADGSKFIAQVLEPAIHDSFREIDPNAAFPWPVTIPHRNAILSHMNREATVWHDIEFWQYNDLAEKLGRKIPHIGNILTASFLYEDEAAQDPGQH